ncbi:MAG TPA: hypothetical protein VGP06_01640, partial [Janthinobacterium sp.]|nr:hypothetical protein [Janthinobacterium sp.]
MTDPQLTALLAEFQALGNDDKLILALLAMLGEPIGKNAILEHLKLAGIRRAGEPYNLAALTET